MKTRMTRKENRRLSLLVAGTLGMTVAFGFAPPWRADVLGVEIGASVAHAEEVTDVSTWENARKSYGSNQTVKVMNGDTELAAFTTNGYVTLSYTPSSGDGTNGSITVDTWEKIASETQRFTRTRNSSGTGVMVSVQPSRRN